MLRARLLSSLFGLVFVACGGARPSEVPQGNDGAPAEPAPVASAEPEQGDSPPDEPDEADDEGDEDDDGSVSLDADEERPSDEEGGAPRNKLYKMVPGGVDVAIDGVMFHVKAEAKRQTGGWGVAVKVKAESEGDATRYLMTPEGGPLAFATKVTQGEKVVTEIGDARKGEGEQTVGPDAPVEFSRSWPPKGTKALIPGQELELQVGLWGLGREPGKTRAVKGFVVVKVVAPRGRPAKAYVNPPG